jgi:hypothetical protein
MLWWCGTEHVYLEVTDEHIEYLAATYSGWNKRLECFPACPVCNGDAGLNLYAKDPDNFDACGKVI